MINLRSRRKPECRPHGIVSRICIMTKDSIAIRSLLGHYARSHVNVIIVYYTDVYNVIFSIVTYAILHKHNYST